MKAREVSKHLCHKEWEKNVEIYMLLEMVWLDAMEVEGDDFQKLGWRHKGDVYGGSTGRGVSMSVLLTD